MLKYIRFFVANKYMKAILKNSDIFGAMSSTLCLTHCVLTPFLLIAPIWWAGLNYFFIAISFVAVFFSVKNTSKKIMKPLLWVGFLFLSFSIINEEYGVYHLPEFVTYLAAINLACLHVYNLKYCQCQDDCSCIEKN